MNRINARIIARITYAAFALCCIIAACDDSSTDTANDIVFPDKSVSYAQHVQPLFNLRCVNAGCHDDVSRASDLSLTSYYSLNARPGIVIPGNSQSSLLAQKIDGRLPHQNIPPLLINTNQINGVKKWIEEGAKKN